MNLTVGGSCQIEFLVDSGANVNIIPKTTWEKCWNDEDMFIYDLDLKGKQTINAYGSKPLKVMGTFRAHIEVPHLTKPKAFEEFIIVDEPGIPLLSFHTARRLGVIKIGVDISNVSRKNETKIFPKVPGLKVRFLVDKSVRPSRNSSFRIPASLEKETCKQLEELERLGIIELARYDSPWMSRMDIVVKDKNKWRLVLDMRGVNKAIIRELHPFPTMKRYAKYLSGARYFTKLDMTLAFHHIELDEESRDMTTFMTPNGPRRFTRLLFGVNCAPEIFQREMERILKGCKGCINYIDDILIFGTTKEQLKKREEKVLKRLEENNLTLNRSKCKFVVEEVEFLGSIIDQNGIRPSPDKVEAIKNFRKPKDVTELRSFIGLVTYISPSIKNFADIMEPLNRMMKSSSLCEWDDEQDKAFSNIKRTIEEEILTRAFFDDTCPTKIYTDASPKGLGAVLVQTQMDPETGQKKDRVIACASKSLTATERRYPQTQKEALAIVWGVEKFDYYLIGRKFEIFTDHEPLKFIFTRSKASDKRSLTRAEGWALRLSIFDYEIRRVSTKENIADPLSRMCEQEDAAFNEENAPHEIASLEPLPDVANIGFSHQTITADEIKEESSKDEEIQSVTKALETGSWPAELNLWRQIEDELSVKLGFLLRGNRFVLPKGLREKALEIAHESHPGVTTMKRTLRERLWWPGMDKQTIEKAEQCQDCIIVSKDGPPAPMKRTPLPAERWEFVAIDFYSAKDPEFIVLVIVDFFSRYSMARLVKTTDFKCTAAALLEIFEWLGRPKKILSDNGPPFQSEEFATWCKNLGIKLIHSTPLWPRQNGMVERFMPNITRVATIAKLNGNSIKETIKSLVYDYNRRPHATTGRCPISVLLGRETEDKLPCADRLTRKTSPIDEYGEMRERDTEQKGKGRIYSDKYNRARKLNVEIGDTVVVKNSDKKKLAPNFNPRQFTVLDKKGEELTLEDPNGGKLIRNSAMTKKLPPKDKRNLFRQIISKLSFPFSFLLNFLPQPKQRIRVTPKKMSRHR